MKELSKKIIDLRVEGRTYNQIVEELGCSKSNVSYICNKYVRDNDAMKDLSRKNANVSEQGKLARRLALENYYAKRRTERKAFWLDRLGKYEDQMLIYYISGLYDGEGRHTSTIFSLSNSNPLIVSTFLNFVQKVLEASYTTRLTLHTSHDTEICSDFWEDRSVRVDAITQVDSRPQKRNYEAKENYGTVNITVRKSMMIREALEEYSFSHT